MEKPPEQAPDPERRDRILGKLGQVWGSVPGWRLAWLVDNLAPPGAEAADDELEAVLDRLLQLDAG